MVKYDDWFLLFLTSCQILWVVYMGWDIIAISRNCVHVAGMVWGQYMLFCGMDSSNMLMDAKSSFWCHKCQRCFCAVFYLDWSGLWRQPPIVGRRSLALHPRGWMDSTYKSTQPRQIQLEQCPLLFGKQLRANRKRRVRGYPSILGSPPCHVHVTWCMSDLTMSGRPLGTSTLTQHTSFPGEEGEVSHGSDCYLSQAQHDWVHVTVQKLQNVISKLTLWQADSIRNLLFLDSLSPVLEYVLLK